MNVNDDCKSEGRTPNESLGEGEQKAPQRRIPAFLFDRSVSPEVGSAIRKLEEKRRQKRGW